ncbi:hypothetical protein Scep_000971 [Stephania cephalantha]|uniref:Protein MIZU-KUSSEI 1-like n=1 Tax=Stephania cephalantha TaxID=152367 RepID=A0AAP0L9T5_9MAGN
MTYPTGGAAHIVEDVITTVDCQKQVKSWRILRSILRFLMPTCECNHFHEEQEGVLLGDHQREEKREEQREGILLHFNNYYHYPQSIQVSNTNTITGTIFGYRHGKVSLCIQSNSKTTQPILLLELAVSTATLAKEMRNGLLRIVLKIKTDSPPSSSLLSVAVWTMYCNGRKMGCAFKRRPTQTDIDVLRLMRNVFVGTGTISGKRLKCDDELMYLRANFERVLGSSDSESFHMISPDGSTGQELSIFFLRIR